MLTLNALWIMTIMFLPVANTLMYMDSWFLPYYVVLTCIFIIAALMRHALRRIDLNESKPSNYSVVKSYAWVFFGICAIPIGVFVPSDRAWAGIVVIYVGPLVIVKILRGYGVVKDDDVSSLDVVAARCGDPLQFIQVTLHYVTKKVMLLTGIPEPSWMKRNNESRKMKHEVIRQNRELFSRISDRMIIFTDAIVAISMTLLIVPISSKSQEYKDQTDFFR